MKLPPAVVAKLPPGRGVNLAALGGGTEAAFQAAVLALAAANGWKVYSVPDSRRATASGWPDLVCGREGSGCVAAELKRVGKKPRADQRWWLDRLAEAGVRVFHWTPADWPAIEEVLR